MTVSEQRDLPIDRRRFLRITIFFGRIILHVIWWDIVVKRVLPGTVLRSRPARWRRHAVAFRALAVAMGGVMIKLGQFLSSRVDVLPPEITDELMGLQDEVPPVPAGIIQRTLRQEMGEPSHYFSFIEPEPLAAASLGQAHRGWLHPTEAQLAAGATRGDAVVVKVQRPGIEHTVRTDLEALRVVARWIMRYERIRRRANVPALMEEFAETLWEELDYISEADNARRFGRMFADDERVCIPKVYDELSSGRIIVLENVESIKIADLAALDEAGIDKAELADRLLDVYFHQIFKEGIFHADPHPGNLFVRPRADIAWTPEAGPRPYELVFVDFGMVGRIDLTLKENLKRVLIGVSQRDARGLTEAYRKMGFFLPSADIERIVEAQAIVLDQLWGRDLLTMAQPDPRELAELSREFRDLLYEFPFQVPQNFIYLGRALGILSGLAAQLDPAINPWYQVERYGRELIELEEAQEMGREMIAEWAKPFLSVPAQLQRVLAAAEGGRLRFQSSPDRLTTQQLDILNRRLRGVQVAMVAAAGLISGTLLFLDKRRREEE
ncbi:MAG: AarF/ABC1/UbiB kinase family protein [Anaerolineales bacterium]|nr:AarF/ABC1/UbiB kinase family protein [Anaerolineales bacterium]MCB0012684.1 AarF/ABC1/UbiB kinase family protein [Anaerolineales bacterium]MCB0016440.1 AarF/ABC1/UbiB kinase family protein [Anaerolineales bacterium]MCB8958985.1 AarF/ABC1/UbiB kinase family protein [Ardenticatenales bacterium]